MMDAQALIDALRRVKTGYMESVGNPARQLVGGGVRGLLGLDAPEYADNLGMEAYRNAAAMGNAPGINAPVGAFKAAAKVVPEAAMFIGALAKTWDKASNAKAVQMEKAGKDAREIWKETGNLKGPDGKWRQEIDDSAASLLENKKARDYMAGPGPAEYPAGPVSNVLDHAQLGAAYPDVMGIRSRLVKGESAAYIPNTGFGEAFDLPSARTQSAALHELQHAIQQREGFAKGGSPEAMADLVSKYRATADKVNQAARQMVSDADPIARQNAAQEMRFYGQQLAKMKNPGATPQEAYRRLAGEAEARATQARMNMKPAERRAMFPYDSYDVPVDQLIVRGVIDELRKRP